VRLRLALDRWYLGLHGLALLRSYPFGSADEASARMEAMRSLLIRQGAARLYDLDEFVVFESVEAYELWAATYDEPNPLIVAEEQALLSRLDGHPPCDALDVATGTGRVAAHLLDRGHRVIACDRSKAMLQRAAEKLHRVAMFQADIHDLPLTDGAVDLVTCSLALTHVPDLQPALGSLARVLRTGGRLVLSDIHPFAVMTGAHAFFRRSDRSRAVTRNELHSMAGYVSAALGAGFSISGCVEGVVDEALLRAFGVEDDPLHPENALLGLPFAIVWDLRKA
jgi:SAM-dependent methyltransferase